MKGKLFIALVLLMLFPVGVNALPVAWDFSTGPLTGSRSTDPAVGGIEAAGGWDGFSSLPNGQGVNKWVPNRLEY